MNNKTKYIILTSVAFLVSVVPPVIATLMQFPVWVETSSEATISGVAVMLMFISCLPFYKAIINYFKSPSAPVVWLCICAFMYVMKSIAEQMFIVSCVGAVSNLMGMVCFRLRDKFKDEGDAS